MFRIEQTDPVLHETTVVIILIITPSGDIDLIPGTPKRLFWLWIKAETWKHTKPRDAIHAILLNDKKYILTCTSLDSSKMYWDYIQYEMLCPRHLI